MSWTWKLATGEMIDPSGTLLAKGYSGAPGAINDYSKQEMPDVGPIPCGTYTIKAPVDSAYHGPYALRLEPAATNNMFGRKGFLIHGDSVIRPGEASEGCIILPRFARERIWESNDHDLIVT